jgi:hypothetical protein
LTEVIDRTMVSTSPSSRPPAAARTRLQFRAVHRYLGGAALAGIALASSVTSARAQSDDQAVVTVVKHFFDGMRTRDTALLRSTVVPSAALQSVSGPTGLGNVTPIDQFIGRIGTGTGPGGDEQIKDPRVDIDGPMASLWAYYTFTRGGETQINHCGVDVFLLRKSSDGWKVFHVSDTRRTEGCAPITH